VITEFSLKRFLTISVIAVIVISLIWTLTGKYYTVLLAYTVSPLLSEGSMLRVEDETFSLTIRRDLVPIEITPTDENGELSPLLFNVDISDQEVREHFFAALPSSTAQTYTTRLDPWVIQSGIIPALSLMMALPVISYVTHVVGLVTIVFSCYFGHLVSLYLIIQRYAWQANHSLEPRHEHDAFLVTGYYFGLLVPLMVLVVVIFFKWRQSIQPNIS